MDPIEKISKYFPHLKLGIPKLSPQPLDDGKIGSSYTPKGDDLFFICIM